MRERSLRGGDRGRDAGRRDDFDPIAEGAKYDLSSEVSVAIWERVRDETSSQEEAIRRFHEVAERARRLGGRLRIDPGKVTLLDAEMYGRDPGWDPFATIAPGKTTRVEAEMRRWARRTRQQEHELPHRQEVMALLQTSSPEARAAGEIGDQGALAGAFAFLDGRDPAGSMAPAGRKPPTPLVPTSAPVELPHRAAMEQLFGVAVGEIAAHVGEGAALAPFGAQGAAWSGTVVFASSDPSLATVAHELAHVQQLRQASDAPSAARPWSVSWDAAEIEADQVAHVVARGGRPAPLSARPAATVSFQQGGGPAPAPVQAELGGVVREALQVATELNVGFAEAVGDVDSLRSNVRTALDPSVADFDSDIVRGIKAGSRRIGAVQLTVDLAAQPGAATITFDRLLVLLGETFVGGELAEFGLPASFGATVALDEAVGLIEEAFETGVAAAVSALAQKGATDETRKALPGVVENAIAQYLPLIAAALESSAQSWDDPMDFLEMELLGAIGKLESLRGDLADGSPTAGPAISRLARYILLLSDQLGSVHDRVERQKAPGKSVSILDKQGGKGTALAQAAIAMQDARQTALDEGDTIRRLERDGARPELLGGQQAEAVAPGGARVETTVQGEEALPVATDDFVLQAQHDIANRLDDQQSELTRMRNALAPPPSEMKSYAKFKEVYARWFSFFSRAERDDSPGYHFFSNLLAMAPHFGEMGWRGWLFSAGAMYASQSVDLGEANTSFLGSKTGLGGVTQQRNQEVHGSAASAQYSFAEVHGTDGGKGSSAESMSRDATLEQGNRNRIPFGQVYGAGGDEEQGKRGQTAFDLGLVPPGAQGGPPNVMTGSASNVDNNRYGSSDHWNYFLAAQVGYLSGQLQTVYEHKVMREEVAEYLLALTQHHNTLQKHYAKTESNVELGDQTARTQGLEESKVTATATYHDPDDTRRRTESEGYYARIKDARTQAAAGPHSGPSLQLEAERLPEYLEESLDAFFAQASEADRIMAILRIATDEYDLKEAIWDQIKPEALWEVAKEAMKMAATMAALSRLGPIGQKVADKIHGYYRNQAKKGSAYLLIQFGVWFEKAIYVSSFNDARHWALPVPSFASVLAAILADHVVDAAGGLGKGWKKGAPDPQTVGDMRAELDPYLKDPKSRADLYGELEGNLRPELEARKQAAQQGQDPPPLTPDQQRMWAMLNAVDPKAAGKLRDEFDLPRVKDSDPVGAIDPAAPKDTLLANEPRRKEVEAQVTAALDDMKVIPGPFRVEVLDPGHPGDPNSFVGRFRTQKGKAAVVVGPDGVPTIYVRSDATAADVHEEAIHLGQYGSNAKMAENIRMLGEGTLKDWDRLDAGTRRDLFLRKLELELDAKLGQFQTSVPGSPEWKQHALQYDQLSKMQREVQGFGDEQIRAMNADPRKQPDYLRDPSWLFAKDATITGTPRTSIDPDIGTLKETRVKDSPLNKRADVETVTRRGEPWTETTVVTSMSSGKVKVERLRDGSGWVVWVGGRRHVTEAKPKVKNGQEIEPGHTLAIEPSREFRVIEAKLEDGSIERRVEEKNKHGKWVKSGSESNLRGRIAEEASKRDIDADLDKQKGLPRDERRAGYEDYQSRIRIDHQNKSGQGFDDVIVEFHRTKDGEVRAVIRVVEVKDFPNRSVPLDKMTAIRGDTLHQNLDALKRQLRAAAKKLRNEAQRDALETAIDNDDYRFEIRLGANTRMGDETAGSHTVHAKLREELNDYFGKDVLASEPSTIDETKIEEVIAGMKTKPAKTKPEDDDE